MTTTAIHPDTVVAVEGLAKSYGAHPAVTDVSFTVQRGSIVGMLGPNGAGKTTSLRALLGLIQPSAGTALIRGAPYRRLTDPATHVGVLIDAGVGHPGRTARGHLRVMTDAMGLPPERIDAVLEQVGLADAAGRRIGGYSQGMRQRLGLAAALLGDPEILVLDEPSNGLDPPGIRWLRTTLRAYAAAGGTVLLSSHVLAEVAQTVDEIVVIDRGRTVVQAPVAELTAGIAGDRALDLEEAFFALTGAGDPEEALR